MEARLQALTAAFHTPMAAARDARYQGDVVGSTRVSSSFDGDVLLGNGTDAEHPHPEGQESQLLALGSPEGRQQVSGHTITGIDALLADSAKSTTATLSYSPMFSEMNVSSKTSRSKRLLKTAPALPRHIEAYLQPQGTKVVEDGQNSEDACFNVLAPTGAHEAGYAAQQVAELQQQLTVVTRELQKERARQAVTTQALEQAACAHQEEIALLQQQFEDVVIQARRQHEHHHRQQQLSMQGKQQEREQALGWKREKGKMELKLQAITESYRKLKETNEKLSADLADSYRRLEHAHHETAAAKEAAEARTRIDQEGRYMSALVQLKKVESAYEESVDKGAALTSTTLDQAAEIFRLNELVRRLFAENTELVGRLRAAHNTQVRGVWVPAA